MERKPPATVAELDEIRAKAIHRTWCTTTWEMCGDDAKLGAMREAAAVREADAAVGILPPFARPGTGTCAAELPATVPASAVDAACRAYLDCAVERGGIPWGELSEGDDAREFARRRMRAALAAFGHAMAPVDPLPDDVHEAAADARRLAELTAAWDAFELGKKVPERLEPGRVASMLRRLAFLREVTLERLGEAQAGAALNGKWLGEAHCRANAERQRAEKAEAALEAERTLEPGALVSIGLGATMLADAPPGLPPCYLSAADVPEVNRGTCTNKAFGLAACDGCGFRVPVAVAVITDDVGGGP